jgi:hypothetical protein
VQHVRGEPGRRLAVERAPLVDAEAVLLVDHDDAQAVELDRRLDQRVRADQQPQLAAGELPSRSVRRAAGRRAGQQRGLDELARHQLLQSREVLLGERLGRRHQRRLGAALDRAQHRGRARPTVLPEPTSPISSRCIGRSAGEVGVAVLHRVALVVGGRERQRVGEPAAGQLAGRLERLGARALAAAGAAAAASATWSSSSSSNASRRRPPSWSPKWAASSAAARSGSRSSVRSRAGSGSSVSSRGAAVLAGEGEDLRRDSPSVAGYGRHLAVGGADRLAGRRVERDAEAVAGLVLALQQQPRARAVLALEPRLVEERRLHRPGGVGHHRLDERLHPRRRTERLVIERTSATTVAVSSSASSADRARGLAVARQVLEQVADRVQPEPLGRRRRPWRGHLDGVAAAVGRG